MIFDPKKREEVEKAIALLQASGYDVFNRSAKVRLTAMVTVPAEIAARKDADGFWDYQRDKIARDLGMELLSKELIKLEMCRVEQTGDLWRDQYTQPYSGSFNLYPAARKEWRR